VNVTSQFAAPNISKQVDKFLRRDWVEYEFGQFTMNMGHYVRIDKYSRRTPSALNLLESIVTGVGSSD
jgi:hypothetical protein